MAQKWAKNQHRGYSVPRRRWKRAGSLSCVHSPTQLCTFSTRWLPYSTKLREHSREIYYFSTPFAARGPSPILLAGSWPWLYWAWSILINHCSCLLLPPTRPNVLDEYLTSEVSWRRPVMSLLAISPFLPILSIPCFSHCFAAHTLLSLLDIKGKTIQHHLMSDAIYVSLSVRCTNCFDVSSDV